MTTTKTTKSVATCLFNSNEHEIYLLLLLLPACLPASCLLSFSVLLREFSFCFLYCIRMSQCTVVCVLSSHLMPLVHFIMRKEEIERVCTIVRRDVWSTITTRNSSSSSNENEISNVCTFSVVAYRPHFNWEKREFQYAYFIRFFFFHSFRSLLFCSFDNLLHCKSSLFGHAIHVRKHFIFRTACTNGIALA